MICSNKLAIYRINKKSNLKGQSQKISINLDESDDEGLALLIPDIQETTSLVQSATYSDKSNPNNKEEQLMSNIEYQISNTSMEEKYLEVMKKLQFGKSLFEFYCDNRLTRHLKIIFPLLTLQIRYI